MKRFVTLASAAAVALALSTTGALAEPMTFGVDKAHSRVSFQVRHFFNKAEGRFEDFDAAIKFDPENVAASSVEVTIRDSSINTANERRDQHLRSEDFFWVEKHPTITFKSTKVVPGGSKERFQVLGDLTMRGVTKPVTLDVEFLGIGERGVGGSSMGLRAGFEAKTRVNRKDYGIVWNKALDQGGVMLGEDVDITISISAVAKNAAAGKK